MKPDYNSPASLRAYLKEKNLGMRKKYGQNFLINPDIRKKLLDAFEIKPGETVWEIGPGIGSMTEGLLERGANLTAFEIDPGFAGILRELFGENENFMLAEGDVFKTWPAVPVNGDVSLFGNLPYNIAAVLLADFIEKKRFFQKMVVTVQHETARRLAAKPGNGDYSSLTVLCSLVYRISPLMVIKGASFYPEPHVNSQGLRFDLLKDFKTPPKYFNAVLRCLFASRRKTIQNNLLNFVSSVIMKNGAEAKTETAREIVSEVFRVSGISGSRRAETLERDEFILLSAVAEELLDRVR